MVAIRPQPGPQETFLATSADIALFGGAAGGGKTWTVIAEPCRHIGVKGFTAVVFRRNTVQARNPGGLWDESLKVYPLLGGVPRESTLEWSFPSGSVIKLAHLEHETTKLDWQGSQVTYLAFDELTHFSESTFWYMLSRNRSTCGVRPYVRATCNPDADSWVADLVRWWIDQETGYPIPERSGVVRWFVRVNNRLEWADTCWELEGDYPELTPKSFTFVPARLEDNPILMRADPGYKANLLALPMVEREQLLGGNWKIRLVQGMYFKEPWFQTVSVAPKRMNRLVRYWDKAAGESKAADYTAGVLMGMHDGLCYVLDVRHGRWSPFERNKVIAETAAMDELTYGCHAVQLWIENEQRGSGKESAMISVRELSKYGCRLDPVRESKELRARPFSAYCEAGNVRLIRAAWNRDYIDELTAFPNPKVHDDQCLVAGTMILTESGVVPIESVSTGDSVVVRGGTCRVSAAGRTGVGRVWRLEASGMTLEGTANHPVWVVGRGFVPLFTVRPDEEILACLSALKPLNMGGGSTGDIPRPRGGRIGSTFSAMRSGRTRRCCSIVSSGKTRMDRFQRASMFTTRMATRSTTASSILSAFPGRATSGRTLPAATSTVQPSSDTSRGFAISQASGIVRRMVGNGIVATPWKLRRAKLPTSGVCANSAAASSWPRAETRRAVASRAETSIEFVGRRIPENVGTAGSNSPAFAAGRDFAPVRVQRVTDTGRTAEVFNLAVETANEYVANGVLVHNCDASSGAFNKLVRWGGSESTGMSGRPRGVAFAGYAGAGRFS